MCACVELTKIVLPSEIGGGVAQPWIIIIIIIFQHCITKIIIFQPVIIVINPGSKIITCGTYRRRTPLLE